MPEESLTLVELQAARETLEAKAQHFRQRLHELRRERPADWQRTFEPVQADLLTVVTEVGQAPVGLLRWSKEQWGRSTRRWTTMSDLSELQRTKSVLERERDSIIGAIHELRQRARNGHWRHLRRGNRCQRRRFSFWRTESQDVRPS